MKSEKELKKTGEDIDSDRGKVYLHCIYSKKEWTNGCKSSKVGK